MRRVSVITGHFQRFEQDDSKVLEPTMTAYPNFVGTLMRNASSPEFERRMHRLAEWIPGKRRVRLFHSVADPHSHLALQALPLLSNQFDVTFELVLIGDESVMGFGSGTVSVEGVQQWTFDDGRLLQDLYADLGFTLGHSIPRSQHVALAAATLAYHCLGGATGAVPLDSRSLDSAIAIGRALWANPDDESALESALQAAAGIVATPSQVAQIGSVLKNNYDRLAQKHLAGGVLYYRGEPYWGIDRLAHLERRLQRAGAERKGVRSQVIFSRTEALRFKPGGVQKIGEATPVELFYSFRSPYSQLILRDLFKLCKHYGVPVLCRPVLPMAMRGLDVSNKKIYIMRDFSREKNRLGLPYDALNDPIGEPTLRALRVWPLAEKHDCGPAFLLAWANLVYGQFVDAGSDQGLRRVVEAAGLSWAEAEPLAHGSDVPEFEEENRRALYEELQHWGVPCVRYGDFVVWGQDRLWALEARILDRCT